MIPSLFITAIATPIFSIVCSPLTLATTTGPESFELTKHKRSRSDTVFGPSGNFQSCEDKPVTFLHGESRVCITLVDLTIRLSTARIIGTETLSTGLISGFGSKIKAGIGRSEPLHSLDRIKSRDLAEPIFHAPDLLLEFRRLPAHSREQSLLFSSCKDILQVICKYCSRSRQ
jgi:hypothetical protein